MGWKGTILCRQLLAETLSSLCLVLGLPNDVHWECEKLKKLDFSHNRLRALPDTFNDLRSLNVMNLSHNYLKELPQSCSWGCINLVRRGGHVMPCYFV